MAYGKMNTLIDIISTDPVKDNEGFTVTGDRVLASVRAYKENKHGSERWANMAVFSEVTAMFRFRKIPDIVVDTTMIITDADGRYNIVSADNVRNRGMYVEVLAEKIEGSKD